MRYVGVSGWDYASWRGRFYPKDVPHRAWLAYAAARMNSVELNGTFYSLKTAKAFRAWAQAVPAGFTFAVKGGRFITHMKKLVDVDQALANFYASGVLALGAACGPFLWQLPEVLAYDEARLERFFTSLPRSSTGAARLAARHDHRVRDPCVASDVDVDYRHALEPRHPSFFTPRVRDLLRAYDVALVSADSAGRFSMATAQTASFAYARLHGSTVLYASGYDDDELDGWAARIRRWRGDVYVYFDNDARGHAPFDAMRLAERLNAPAGAHARGTARR